MTNVGMAGTIETGAPKGKASHPLQTKAVLIDDHCTGDRWSAQDEPQLARLIAIIAMGQAAYAAHILKELLPATPAFTDDDLRREATVRLTVQEDGKKPRTGYPQWQRDGFIFEVISWIAARQTHGERALLKDPHVSATSQGLDGLMIEPCLSGSLTKSGSVSAHEFLSTSEYSVATLAATSLIRTSEPFNRPPLSSEISARLIA